MRADHDFARGSQVIIGSQIGNVANASPAAEQSAQIDVGGRGAPPAAGELAGISSGPRPVYRHPPNVAYRPPMTWPDS